MARSWLFVRSFYPFLGSSAKCRKRFRSRPFERAAGVGENLRGDAFLFGQEAEKQMLGAHVRMMHPLRLGHRQLERLLRPRRVRKIRDARFLGSPPHDPEQPVAECVRVDIEIREHGTRYALVARETEKDVLRADVFVAEIHRLFTRRREHFPYALGEVEPAHSARLFAEVESEHLHGQLREACSRPIGHGMVADVPHLCCSLRGNLGIGTDA